eukprot:m.293789 g.293789  ORF g.293789 m.293789 type:complete len:150 (+) comp20026_c0_seq1:540-989(+)
MTMHAQRLSEKPVQPDKWYVPPFCETDYSAHTRCSHPERNSRRQYKRAHGCKRVLLCQSLRCEQTVVAETALAVAAGLKAIYPGRCVSLYGCSRWAKAAVWALAKQSVNKHAAVLDRVYADSPGATDLDSSICIASVSYFIECDRAVYA